MGAWSLPNGLDMIVTIARVEKATIKGERGREDVRPIVFFSEFKEPMVLNVTNGKTIHAILGSEYVEDWTGGKVTLYVAKNIRIGHGAETVDGLRVRPTAPKIDKKREMQIKINNAFKIYKGEDKSQVLAELKSLKESGKDSIENLQDILKTLTA